VYIKLRYNSNNYRNAVHQQDMNKYCNNNACYYSTVL